MELEVLAGTGGGFTVPGAGVHRGEGCADAGARYSLARSGRVQCRVPEVADEAGEAAGAAAECDRGAAQRGQVALDDPMNGRHAALSSSGKMSGCCRVAVVVISRRNRSPPSAAPRSRCSTVMAASRSCVRSCTTNAWPCRPRRPPARHGTDQPARWTIATSGLPWRSHRSASHAHRPPIRNGAVRGDHPHLVHARDRRHPLRIECLTGMECATR